MNCQIDTIKEFEPLHNPEHPDYNRRYQVYYGGRAGRKSWEIAAGLLMRGMLEQKLILCTREIQLSITDSVLKLLANTIRRLGMEYFYEVQRTRIIGQNGTEFIFKGLNQVTIDNIKSLEGADICWVEEAHSVSEDSWLILIPTIRKEGSQIFVSFNPDLVTDPAYNRFIKNTHPDAYVAKVDYLMNPDCPDVTKKEAEYLKEVDYEAYAHVYLGEVRQHSDAQIFKNKYKVEPFEVDETFGAPLQGGDWGFSTDPATLIRSYVKGDTLYIRNEAYQIGCEIEDTTGLYDRINSSDKYMTIADNARPELVSYMQRQGYQIKSCMKWKGSVEDGISYMRSFRNIIIHPDCKHTAEEFRLYSYKTDKRTGDVLPDIVDKHNHCIDAIRYSLEKLIKPGEEIFII